MAESNIMGLFANPEDIRQKQRERLLNEGRQSAGMLMQGGGSGLAQAIKGYGANVAQYMPLQADRMKRGLMGAAAEVAGLQGNEEGRRAIQLAAMSPQERQATEQQRILAEGDTNNIQSLQRQITNLKKSGANPAAIEFLSNKLAGLQDKALARERQGRLDKQQSDEIAEKRRLRNIQINEIETRITDKAEQKQALTNMLPSIDSSYMSDEMKAMVTTLDPADGLNFVKEAQARERASARLNAFNERESAVMARITEAAGGGRIEDLPVKDVNTVFSGLIRSAKAAGLDDRAKQLESERAAIIKNKNDIQGIEEDLRKTFRKDPMLATQREVVDKAKQGIKFLQTGKGASDIAGIITFMKSLDPGSVVREGEFATAASVGGALDSFNAAFEKPFTGETLTDNQRKELAITMQIASQAAVESYNMYRKTELDAYSGRGYDSEYIVGQPLTAPTLGSLNSTQSSSEVDDETAGSMFGSFGDAG